MKPSFDKYKLQDRKNKVNDTIKKKKEVKKGVSNPVMEQQQQEDSQIISGYFLQELPYKEMIIARKYEEYITVVCKDQGTNPYHPLQCNT